MSLTPVQQSQLSATAPRTDWSWPAFAAFTLVQLWLAHAIAFFAHEYAHSLTAWLLGWKSNPLALDYAHPTLVVLLIQLGIDQNVNELPIFATGHGPQGAIISAAGAVFGDAILTYSLSRWGYSIARRHAARAWAMLCYWVCVASVGNILDYVPIRTFTDGTDLYQDLFAVEKGLGWSPSTLLLAFGIPSACVVGYFFARIQPATLRWLFPRSAARRALMAVLTAFVLFDFYGAAGWSSSGPISHTLSVVSVCVVAPIAAAITAARLIRKPNQSSPPA